MTYDDFAYFMSIFQLELAHFWIPTYSRKFCSCSYLFQILLEPVSDSKRICLRFCSILSQFFLFSNVSQILLESVSDSVSHSTRICLRSVSILELCHSTKLREKFKVWLNLIRMTSLCNQSLFHTVSRSNISSKSFLTIRINTIHYINPLSINPGKNLWSNLKRGKFMVMSLFFRTKAFRLHHDRFE